MKKGLLVMAAVWLSLATFAQQDSSKPLADTTLKTMMDTARSSHPDTIRVGNFVIVKQNKKWRSEDRKRQDIYRYHQVAF